MRVMLPLIPQKFPLSVLLQGMPGPSIVGDGIDPPGTQGAAFAYQRVGEIVAAFGVASAKASADNRLSAPGKAERIRDAARASLVGLAALARQVSHITSAPRAPMNELLNALLQRDRATSPFEMARAQAVAAQLDTMDALQEDQTTRDSILRGQDPDLLRGARLSRWEWLRRIADRRALEAMHGPETVREAERRAAAGELAAWAIRSAQLSLAEVAQMTDSEIPTGALLDGVADPSTLWDLSAQIDAAQALAHSAGIDARSSSGEASVTAQQQHDAQRPPMDLDSLWDAAAALPAGNRS